MKPTHRLSSQDDEYVSKEDVGAEACSPMTRFVVLPQLKQSSGSNAHRVCRQGKRVSHARFKARGPPSLLRLFIHGFFSSVLTGSYCNMFYEEGRYTMPVHTGRGTLSRLTAASHRTRIISTPRYTTTAGFKPLLRDLKVLQLYVGSSTTILSHLCTRGT